MSIRMSSTFVARDHKVRVGNNVILHSDARVGNVIKIGMVFVYVSIDGRTIRVHPSRLTRI